MFFPFLCFVPPPLLRLRITTRGHCRQFLFASPAANIQRSFAAAAIYSPSWLELHQAVARGLALVSQVRAAATVCIASALHRTRPMEAEHFIVCSTFSPLHYDRARAESAHIRDVCVARKRARDLRSTHVGDS